VSEENPLTIPQGYEPCEECGAPLDPQQRYCVECAARRGNGSNPSSRYFAAMSKKSRRPLTKSQAKGSGSGGGGSRAAAVGFFALLPIAVALGVVVGRSGGSGDSNEEALLKALHQAEQQQVAAAPVVTEETATTASTANKAKGAAKGAKQGGKAGAKNGANNAAKNAGTNATKSKQGAVEKIETYKPSKEDVEEDTKLVEENPEQTGENYIKAQQNLPEVIVVGGEEEGGGGSELPPGVEP
jgi:hypothetical protein